MRPLRISATPSGVKRAEHIQESGKTCQCVSAEFDDDERNAVEALDFGRVVVVPIGVVRKRAVRVRKADHDHFEVVDAETTTKGRDDGEAGFCVSRSFCWRV